MSPLSNSSLITRLLSLTTSSSERQYSGVHATCMHACQHLRTLHASAACCLHTVIGCRLAAMCCHGLITASHACAPACLPLQLHARSRHILGAHQLQAYPRACYCLLLPAACHRYSRCLRLKETSFVTACMPPCLLLPATATQVLPLPEA